MIAHLADRGVLSVGGPDAVPFLNGLISQDVTKVTPERPLYGCLLTPQGKYFADFFIILQDDAILLDVSADRLDAVLQRLNMFRLRSKVVLSDVSDDYRIYAAWNAERQTTLPGLWYDDPRWAGLGQRGLTQMDVAADATLADYHDHRARHGAPDVADFEIERTALLEANIDKLNGIAWDKGCYMGQELTARTHYRGLVKKRLLPFAFTGAAPAFDSELRLNDVVIGHARGTASSHGLALVKLEHAEPAWAGSVTVNGQIVTLLKPDWFLG